MDLLRTIHRIQRAIGFDTSFKEKSQRNHTMCAMRVVKLSCSRVEVIVNEVQTARRVWRKDFFVGVDPKLRLHPILSNRSKIDWHTSKDRTSHQQPYCLFLKKVLDH